MNITSGFSASSYPREGRKLVSTGTCVTPCDFVYPPGDIFGGGYIMDHLGGPGGGWKFFISLGGYVPTNTVSRLLFEDVKK